MRTSELVPGEVYVAEYDYSTWQVVPIEAATWTKRNKRVDRQVIVGVAPATPFDPMTGEPNPMVERTQVQTVYVEEFVPGSHRGKSGPYLWSDKNEVGVPCFVRYKYDAERGAENWYPRIIRPGTIKSTWADYKAALRAAQKVEEDRKAAKAAYADEMARLDRRVHDLLPEQKKERTLVGKNQWDSAAVLSLDVLSQLLDLAEAE